MNPCSNSSPTAPAKPPALQCFAHRGATGKHSENSLGAIAEALAIGAEGIEIDVWAAQDALVVYHDRRCGRLLPGTELITDLSLAELRRHQLPCGDKVPTLEEVLDLVGNHARLNIEIKGIATAQRVAKQLQTSLRNHDHIIVSSFDHPQLLAFKRYLPGVETAVLVEGVPLEPRALVERMKAQALHLGLGFLRETTVTECRSAGIPVRVYTANNADDWNWVGQLGVAGVFTDRPEAMMRWRGAPS